MNKFQHLSTFASWLLLGDWICCTTEQNKHSNIKNVFTGMMLNNENKPKCQDRKVISMLGQFVSFSGTSSTNCMQIYDG